MTSNSSLIEDFLAQKRIAVTGVSRTRQDAANTIYKKLRATGYQVFPINPNAETVEGDTCYPDLKSIPDGVNGVVIATSQEAAAGIVRQCVEVGVSRVWMHRAFEFMGSSVSEEAVAFCRENGISVIEGGCPMMFCEPVDFGHKCMRWVSQMTGGLPK
ncbi:MAG: CoA-binding protein [Chloroflexi bacterium]|nr:CoA-binding protein [Chloroflexota bacterium]